MGAKASTLRRARAVTGAMVIGTGMVVAATGAGSAAWAGTPVPGAPSCPMFPADNVWNTDISTLPVDPHSAQWLASMDSATTDLHPDFGPSSGPDNPYGMPYTVVSPTQPFVNVSFEYADESDPGPYPFGADTPIEGGEDSTGDHHAIMIDPETCTLYELYDATYSANGSTAGSGAIWNLRSDALRPAGWTSADAAGLAIMPGLVRYDEVLSGSITHAIRMTAQTTDRSYIWPARHEAGARSDPSLPPMGARFRLKADFDMSGYSPQAQVLLRAMQHYGLILADNGSNWYFGGTADPHWPIALIDELKAVPASAFEAVHESSLMVSPDSGQARQPAPVPPPAPVAVTNPPSTTVAPASNTTVVPAPTTTAPASNATVAPASTTTAPGVRREEPPSAGRALAMAAATRTAGIGRPMTALLLLGTLAAMTGSAWVMGAGRRRRRRRA